MGVLRWLIGWLRGEQRIADRQQLDIKSFEKDLRTFEGEMWLMEKNARLSRSDSKKIQAKYFTLDKWYKNICALLIDDYDTAEVQSQWVDAFVERVWNGKNFNKFADYLNITRGDIDQLGARIKAALGG